jgi:hypothetical protein
VEGGVIMANAIWLEISKQIEIGKADFVFHILKDEIKLGRLKISKGSLEWCPKNKSNGIHILWDEAAEMFEKRK